MSASLKHLVSLDSTRRRKQRNSASCSPAVASSPALDSHVRLPTVGDSSVIRDTALSYLSFFVTVR